MFTIGDFARLGQVSVRMLRHYDGIGLHPYPGAVNPWYGSRGFLVAQQVRAENVDLTPFWLTELGARLPAAA